MTAAAVLGRGEDDLGETGRDEAGRGEEVRTGMVVREEERSDAEVGVACRCTMFARRAVVRGRLRSMTALISALCLWATAVDIARATEASPLACISAARLSAAATCASLGEVTDCRGCSFDGVGPALALLWFE